jgi:hypothetical protein
MAAASEEEQLGDKPGHGSLFSKAKGIEEQSCKKG